MNVNEVARSIGMPLEKWGGHCYQVVAAFLAADVFDNAEPVTGYFHDADGQNVTDHAWLKLSDGRICDPTRFWMEDKPPYIFIGNADYCYDEKGVRWNRELARIRRKFIPTYPDLKAAFDTLISRDKPQDANPGAVTT
jgi:hypothetical protein